MTTHLQYLSRLLVIVGLMTALAVQASPFAMHVKINDNAALVFGLGDATEDPLPPNFVPAELCYLYFQGHGDAGDSSQVLNDLARCYKKFFASDSKAATWRLVSEKGTTVTFALHLQDGQQFPAGATLQVRKEQEADVTPISDGASFRFEDATTYVIEYAEAEEAILPPPPANSHDNAILRGASVAILDLQAPEGYALTARDYTCLGQDNKPLDGANLSLNEDGNLDITSLPDGTTTITFQVAYTKDGNTTDYASVVITVDEGVTASLLTDKIIVIDPMDIKDEPYAVTIQYAIVAHAEKINQEKINQDKGISFSFELPCWNAADQDKLTLTAATLTTSDDPDQSAGTVNLENSSLTLTAQEAVLTLTIQASKELKYGGSIYATLDGLTIPAPYIIVKGSQTLDFDQNGVVNMNDAIFYYMFVSLQSSATTDDLLFYAENNTSEEVKSDVVKALQYLQENWKSTSLEENVPENIEQLTDSSIYLFMYIALDDIAATKEDLAIFSTSPQDLEKAEKALSKIRALILK